MAAERAHNKTQTIVDDIKSGLHGIHGAGEAIRGGAMEALDGVFHKKEGEAKDRDIYERGLAEMRGAEDRFETKPLPPRKDDHHGFGHHHELQSQGQGSHFTDAHARDVAGATHHNATTAGRDEAESLDAAKVAWQAKH